MTEDEFEETCRSCLEPLDTDEEFEEGYCKSCLAFFVDQEKADRTYKRERDI